jgi:biotin carboxylase
MQLDKKKLLILGGNPETIPLVLVAQKMGIEVYLTDDNPNSPAKKFANKSFNVNGLDVEGIIELAVNENIDGVLVGVADILVKSYVKVCYALKFPCYATEELSNIFSHKDIFKAKIKEFDLSGIPEYELTSELLQSDLDKIHYPVMVKPVDNGGGVGMTCCYNESEIKMAVTKALNSSKRQKFIVERYMECSDVGIYYTFQDGVCSTSLVYDRYTSGEQEGVSRVCLGGTYPSKYIDIFLNKTDKNLRKMFNEIGVKNGVLMLSAFFENDEFYFYDPGFRLQGESPNLFLDYFHGYDQREQLIKFSLTGSMGDKKAYKLDDPFLNGNFAATLWILLKEGEIKEIQGFEILNNNQNVIEVITRLKIGDIITKDIIGTEKQVYCRIYIAAKSKYELSRILKFLQNNLKVISTDNQNMVLNGFNVDQSII